MNCKKLSSRMFYRADRRAAVDSCVSPARTRRSVSKHSGYFKHFTPQSIISINFNLQLLIFLLNSGEMLLVSFQKSCMKKLNPVPRDQGGSVPIQCVKKSSRLALNPRSAVLSLRL